MEINVQVIFYSTWGHIHKMAEAVARGAREVKDARVELFQVPELMPEATLEAMGAKAARAAFAHIPIAQVEKMTEADAIIFGTPTRFGNMCAQMRNFMDQAGGLWTRGSLVGKVGSVFASTSTQHGGQEVTITGFHVNLLAQGMVVVGLPYSLAPGLTRSDEMSGGSVFGATTIASSSGTRMPSEGELEMAAIQGRHVAAIARKLKLGAE